jgi:hypothetical protein
MLIYARHSGRIHHDLGGPKCPFNVHENLHLDSE